MVDLNLERSEMLKIKGHVYLYGCYAKHEIGCPQECKHHKSVFQAI